MKRDKPVAAAYPDIRNENIPLVPKIDYDKPPPVTVLRKIIRTVCSALSRGYQCGIFMAIGLLRALLYLLERLGGPVSPPWKDLDRALRQGTYTFVEKARMPEGFPLIDPSDMDREYALVWIKWLSRPQEGLGDESTWFIWKTVLTPSVYTILVRDDAVSKKKVMRGATEVLELVYDGWVEKCQVGGEIKFPEESHEYQDYLTSQMHGALGTSRPHLLGLPCDYKYQPTPVLTEEDIDFIVKLLVALPSSEKERVVLVLRSLNKMYMLLPAEVCTTCFSRSEFFLIYHDCRPKRVPGQMARMAFVRL